MKVMVRPRLRVDGKARSAKAAFQPQPGKGQLLEFAARLASNVRAADLPVRYGGEEFVVVMPDTDVAFAMQVSERLRKSIETTPFEISRDPRNLKLTIPSASPSQKAKATAPAW